MRDFWIGRTYVHQACSEDRKEPGEAPGPLEFRAMTDEDLAEIAQSSDPGLRNRSGRCRPGLKRFGAWMNGELAGVCGFEFGEEYLRAEAFFPLGGDQAELTDIFTCSNKRGAGVARRLIRFSTEQMHGAGFHSLYAKVWHSNHLSSRAFLAAGWSEYCFFVRLQPKGNRRVWHLEWRRPGVQANI